MAKQLRLALGRLSARQFAPVGSAAVHARALTKKVTGNRYQAPSAQLQVDPMVGHHLMSEYRSRQNEPPSDRLQRSYAAMRDDVNAQYEHMTRPREEGGMGIHHEVTAEDPYATPGQMAHDVRKNRTIKTLSTETTGGHSFFTNEENDRFRAVHDVFGHAAVGRGFSRHGEEAAWRSHVQMFSPEAREAMTSETRGQNSYLNYHPGGANFPEQGMVGMSKLAQSPEAGAILRRATPKTARPQGEQLRLPL